MCQNHTGNTITQEDLNALAALAGYTLPTPAQLEGTVLPQGWSIVPGEIPAPTRRNSTLVLATPRAGKAPAAAPRPVRTAVAATWFSARPRAAALPHRGQPHPHGPARRRGRNQCPRRARCR